MTETVGTLNLKIARLENRLVLLEKQQRLSLNYPDHLTRLAQEKRELELLLRQLYHQRGDLLYSFAVDRHWEAADNECCQGKASLYAIS